MPEVGRGPRTAGSMFPCPYCGHGESAVHDSRPAAEGTRRRRRCLSPGCGLRFTTFERVATTNAWVVKRSGRHEAFDQDKVERSIRVALVKRNPDPERVAALIGAVAREVEVAAAEGYVSSSQIGESVLRRLWHLDDVAALRYASVYRDFQELADFQRFIQERGGG